MGKELVILKSGQSSNVLPPDVLAWGEAPTLDSASHQARLARANISPRLPTIVQNVLMHTVRRPSSSTIAIFSRTPGERSHRWIVCKTPEVH